MKYIYIGVGMGIPGLPHVITDKEAKEKGVADILKDAIAAGNYKPEKKMSKSKEASDG